METTAGTFTLPGTFTLIVLMVFLALLPFLALMVTSFVKIAVVLSLVRNALGIQQIPPNMALYGLALILTIYIMSPVINSSYELVQDYNFADLEQAQEAFTEGSPPFRDFLTKHTEEREIEFFVTSARLLWPQSFLDDVAADNFAILIPSFMVSELTSAFKIGFLIYLPFIAIDLIVSNLLLAMGMMMVSPMTISLPLKLFLFVMIDGWTNLIHGLVLTYS